MQKPQVAAAAAAKLRLAQPMADSRASKVYIVRMAGQPAVSYKGGLSGYASTKAAAGQRYNARSGQSEAYTRLLQSQQEALLASVGASDRKIYSYVHTLNGFAARLTPTQAAKLRKDKRVLNIWEDRLMRPDTNNSPAFLGITNQNNGLRGALGLTGEDVIIGVVDTGIVQEHPSFADTNYGAPPAHWGGICQTGQRWSSADCTDKLIGARWFAAGFTSGGSDLADGEFLSARDSDGHGTHTASTAGGNRVQASLNGEPLARVSGMAYRARIAAYKACWTGPDFTTTNDDGCTFSDSAAAVDAAVSDGVDVINFSVGTSGDFTDPVDIAFLFAADAGVFVSRSAGNSGPGVSTTAAGEPWVTTVGASTQRGTSFAQATTVNAPVSVAGDYPSLEGAITQPLVDSGDVTGDLAAADPLEACAPISAVTGLVLILRGNCDFTVKITNAVAAGATGVIVYTQAGNPKTIMGGAATPETQSIPGVMVDNEVGVALLAEITNAVTVNATLSPTTFLEDPLVGNIMAGFSSRGPFLTEPSWIKPDVTAPGVQILAGMTPEPADGSTGDFFQYLQGTSMSTPHVTGIGALLREAHPDWSPAAIRSALMTTARTNVKKEDGVTRANPFDFGSGHIVPNSAVDPGLVYDTEFLGYLAGTCGTVTPLVSDGDCEFLEGEGYHLGASNLNLASIGVNGVLGSTVVHRTVTNVSDAEATYTATVTPPPGFRVVVEPSTLTLGAGESGSFEVRIRNRAAPAGVWRFGSLVWSDGTHEVRSPIALNGQALQATASIAGTGPDGEASIDVAFGFNGAYTAAPHGLAEPTLSLGEIEDDPANSFDFDFGPDEPITFLADLPAGTVYAQWSIFDAYNDSPDHDLDMYLFYCPDFVCTQIDASLGLTGEESVSVRLPANDDAIDDPYVVFIHGYQTAGGAVATAIQFDWQAVDDLGNLTVTGPTSATIGGTGTVDLQWAGLPTGPGEKQVGAVSHSDPNGVVGVTSINVENDEGGGFCDLVAC